jgi:DNA polymerase-4
VAPNKFVAKIASDLEKPDGLVVVDPGAVQTFLDPLPVTRLWGVGVVAAKRLRVRGVTTIAELRARPQSWLQEMFGRHGQHLWRLAHGIDDRPVTPESEAKSISHETTFEEDISDFETLRAWLSELTEQVGVRLRRRGLHGRTVQLKIRFADFRTITRAQTMPEPTNVTRNLWQVAAWLLQRNLPALNPGVRLLGVGVSGFERAPLQAPLFDQASRENDERLDAVSDSVNVRFGASALRRAADLRRPR